MKVFADLRFRTLDDWLYIWFKQFDCFLAGAYDNNYVTDSEWWALIKLIAYHSITERILTLLLADATEASDRNSS